MKYNAFISYRHADPDDYIAGLIHKKLETFRVPRRIRKATGIKKIERLFRDQEELPIDSSLSDNIDAALQESEFLIVICSPRLIESRWCRAEIENFIKIRDRDHILAVLVEGEPEEAFPDLIRFDEEGNPVEPLAADVRGATKAEMKRKLNGEILRLAASLLHCGYDDLRQRHRERLIKRVMIAMTALLLLMGGFAGYYAYTAAQIAENYRDKQVNQSKYLADTALDQLEAGDRMTAIQVALEALPSGKNDRPYVAKAEYALNQTLYSYAVGGELLSDRALVHKQPVSDFEMSSEGNYVVTLDQGETVTVFDTVTGEKKFEVKAPLNEDNTGLLDVEAIHFMDEEAVFIVYEDEMCCYGIDGELLYTFKPSSDAYLTDCKYHSESGQLALVSADTISFIDPKTGTIKSEANVAMPKEDFGTELISINDESFGSEMAFSSDGSRFAIGYFMSITNESPTGKVYVCDTSNAEGYTIDTANTYIEQVLFDDNDHLIAASDGYDESHILLGKGLIEYFDLNTRASLWQTPYDYEVYVMAGSSLQMFIRDYNDDLGQRHHDAVYSINNSLESINMETGEKTCALKKSSSVTGLFVIKESPLVYTLERSGAFTVQNTEIGREFTDNAVDTGLTIVEAKNAKGTIGVQGYQSPDLIILRYCEGYGIEKVNEFEDDVVAADYSMDGSLVSLQIGRGEDLVIKEFRTDDMSEIGEFRPNDYVDCWKMDDAGRIYVFSDGILYRYDPSTDETLTAQSKEEYSFVSDYVIDLEAHKAIGYTNGLLIIDTDTMEVIADVLPEAGVKQVALGGADGNLLITVQTDGTICLTDISDPDNTVENEISDEKITCYLGSDLPNNTDLSADGKLAVFNCTDGYARVYDIENGVVCDEIPFDGRYRSFLRFSPDNSVLMMQGDDYYFRAYDLASHKVKAYADGQYYEIEDAIYENGKVKLVSSPYLYILNEDTYDLVAAIDGGRAASFAKDQVLVGRYETLYKFPYQDLSELQDIAAEQLNGATLSEEKRIQLNLD